MFSKCKNFRIRQKNYRRIFYCIYKKRAIVLDECKNCSNLNLIKNKPIKKISKNKINVKKDIYDEVLERDKGCRLYNKTCEGRLELHHIYYRSERKDLINDINNCIMLCTKHHKEVHSNKDYWQPKLLKMIKGE